MGTQNIGGIPSTAYNVLSRVLAAGTLDLGAIQILMNPSLQNIMLLDQTGHTFHLRCLHALPLSVYEFDSSKERLALKCILEMYLPFHNCLCKESTHGAVCEIQIS